jgi:hypothetical protein
VDAWPEFVSAVLDRHGVADVALAEAHGIGRNRFFRRTAEEGWEHPAAGVRVHPHASRSVQRSLLVVCSSSRDLAAASREAAAWLHGLRQHPPDRASVVCRHTARCRSHAGVVVHRARWLSVTDVVEVQGVPTLDVPALLLTSNGATAGERRARLIDALHRGLTTTDAVLDRIARIGPVTGKGGLRQQCLDLACLLVESTFQDVVADELVRLGYPASRSAAHIDTADGRGVTVDVPLLPWQVAVEPEGDTFHRTREQRRLDRRRAAAFASTDWARVPVDRRDWLLDRDHVLDAIDDAIAAQRRRGLGADAAPPRRPRRAVPPRRPTTGY